MASRDGKQQLREPVGTADEIMAEAAKANRRMSRTRDLILGPMLLVGGIVVSVFLIKFTMDVINPTPDPQRPPSGRVIYPLGLTSAAVTMLILGTLRTIRGLRGRSS